MLVSAKDLAPVQPSAVVYAAPAVNVVVDQGILSPPFTDSFRLIRSRLYRISVISSSTVSSPFSTASPTGVSPSLLGWL